MDDRTNNRLTMVGTCITVAESAEHQPVWQGQEPAAFGSELTALKTKHGQAQAMAGQADSDTTGVTQSKEAARTALEDAAFKLASALCFHFTKTGDQTQLAKVNISRSGFDDFRDQNLISQATEIRDIGEATKLETDAAGRGVTDARITAVTDTLAAFQGLLNAPRAGIVDSSARREQLKTLVGELVNDVTDMDKLVVQFDGSDAGKLFIEAWERARIIVDAGHGPGTGGSPPSPPPPPPASPPPPPPASPPPPPPASPPPPPPPA